jgi:hypothetical protein
MKNITADTCEQRSRTRDQSGRSEAQKRFLACFAGSCNVLRAARAAKVGRATHYQWLDEDPTYRARFQEAMRIGIRTLEDEAVRRAYEGVKKLVFWKGKPVRVNGELVYETEYDSNLLIFLLKGYDRKRFGDKNQVDVKFPTRIEDLPEELLDQFIEQFAALAEAHKQKQLEAPATEQTVDVKP